jgi:hypothetical protein
MEVVLRGSEYSATEKPGISEEAFQTLTKSALLADDTLDEIAVAPGFTAEDVDPESQVLLQEVVTPPTVPLQKTGDVAVAGVAELVDKIESGEARILSGSSTDLLMIAVDGKVYIIVGHQAEMVVNRALEINGFYGTYMTTYNIARGGVVDQDDEDNVVVIDPDGRSAHEEA